MTILDPGQPAHGAAEDRLRAEPIAWLTTVAPSGQPRSADVPAYVEKYRALMAGNGWTPDSFADLYPHVIRVTPTRARIW